VVVTIWAGEYFTSGCRPRCGVRPRASRSRKVFAPLIAKVALSLACARDVEEWEEG
jgi:hypothetical protein